MAMGTERSRALHNFTMPSGLRWGNQRFLRCMKVNSAGQIFAAGNKAGGSEQNRHRHPIQQRRTTRDRDAPEYPNGSPKVSPEPDGARRFSTADSGIAAIREKVMFDLQTAADKMKDAIFKDGGLEEGTATAAAAEGEAHRPWNLRTRRASSKAIVSVRSDSAAAASVSVLKPDLSRPNSSTAAAAAAYKSPINGIEATASGGKRERPKFSVALSKRDIEEDFFAMVGHRPPRRPKKRAKFVQKELDSLFPGLWLTEVTPDMYKVSEPPQ